MTMPLKYTLIDTYVNIKIRNIALSAIKVSACADGSIKFD